ncbi:predicted protein [Aspergillus nidulans FGSC A4]|uniref:Uncharacterized protein n=1 Tax=Emericella nidulans (strain FGSC A4 / ATCC 38163 / CBS 112.46 / NRRL 194 / M139) TaxID=227321 RepID=Q5B256_EMENI|nr:hypothetical protein [Aspergillus nidulans FGSC A4]EAA62534.1 predicted protein [Aspergillus nidulans FGSC A4]CBF82014.1 TPA: conserved hypothetical protein [Aspergillus nidulans FGSC A4]|eukprot:XP_662978.1 predicted protein [Aspergillus nidulans FGSC A4]
MAQTLCQFVNHVDALQHTIAQLNKQFLPPSPTFTHHSPEDQESTDQALAVVKHTADGQYDPAGNEHIPTGPNRSSSLNHDGNQDHEDGERLACLYAEYGVDNSWHLPTNRVRTISYPLPEPQPLNGPEPTTGMALYRSLPLPTSPRAQTPAAVKAEQSKATVQGKPKGRSHSVPIMSLRSLYWYEMLDYESEPNPGSITWEESAEEDVCIEGTGPFWSEKEVGIEGYIDGRCASIVSSIDREQRSMVWETELRIFQQAHELERAKKEVARLKERIKDLQVAGRIYRDKLTMATQGIEEVKEQWRRDKSDLMDARECITWLEMQWGKDHAELLIARDYITELEKTGVQCDCWRKRKWELDVPGSTKKAKANGGNARRRSYDDFWAAQESRRSVLFS